MAVAESTPPATSPDDRHPSPWDAPAVISGAVVSLVIALGATGITTFLDRSSPVRSLLLAVTMLGFVLGAAMAAWAQRRNMPLAHGITAAVCSYVAAETVFVVVKLIRGTSISWLGVMLKVTLVVGCGLFGSALGALLRRRGFVPSAERGAS